MQWDLTEEHSIYSDKKAQRINDLCDMFDIYFDVPINIGSQCQEGYAVDVFELPKVDEEFNYTQFLRNSLLAYLDIYREYDVKGYKELFDRRSKDKLALVPIGKIPIEELLRNIVPIDKYTPRHVGSKNELITLKEQVEKYYESYESGIKTVVNELEKIGDTNAECFEIKINEVTHDYNGLVTGTYWGIVFDMKAFICGKYLFLLVYGSSE